LNKGLGPMNFMLKDLANLVKTGDTNWVTWFGTDKSKWVFNTACCADQVNYRMATCGAAPCTNKCDDTGECAGKCADLVKKYPCEQYYAPGKPYAGWCDKTCAYGTCKKTQVFPFLLERFKPTERPCVNKCDLPENAILCTNLQCEELVQKFPCDKYYAPGKQFAGWCDKQCGYGSCPSPSLSPLVKTVPGVRPEIVRLVYGL